MTNNGNKPKRHHFLPKFYLNGFARDGLVWLYDREKKEYRCQQPLNTAVIGNFYVFENTEGEKDYSLESFFSKIEGSAKSTIGKLEAGGTISPEERLYLANFIALLMVRSPKFDRLTNEVADSALKHVIKHAVPTVEAAEKMVQQHGERTGEKQITAESMFAFIHNEKFRIKVSRNTVISIMLEQAQKVTFEVAMMDWMIMHAHPTSAFITSDEPIGFIVPDEFRKTGEPVLGLASQKIVKFVPLSQKVAIALGQFGGGLGHLGMPRDQVRSANKMVATECDRYVIGRDEALVRSVVKQSKVDQLNPGTRMKVEHVPHPDDPNRTFLVTRRVMADAPDKPLEITPTVDSKKFPQCFSLEDNQKVVLDFENLLRRHQMEIPMGSPLEEACTAILEMLEMHRDKAVHDKKLDCREKWRRGFFLADIARKALRAESHADFRNLLLHLRLLLEPANFSQFSAIQASASPKEKETNNKVFELFVATILFQICSNLRFDDPKNSRAGNPDVIGEYKTKRWGFACKVSHSENPLTFLDRIRDGIEQIEKADVDHGIVIVNLKNLIPHDIIWPAKRDGVNGEWTYGAFPFRDGPSEMIQIIFQKFQQQVYALTGGHEAFVSRFAGKKAVPLVLMFYCSVTGYSPDSGVVIPIIVKRVFGLGAPMDKLPPEAREIGDLFNDFLHDKIG